MNHTHYIVIFNTSIKIISGSKFMKILNKFKKDYYIISQVALIVVVEGVADGGEEGEGHEQREAQHGGGGGGDDGANPHSNLRQEYKTI